jgi:TonB family protein
MNTPRNHSANASSVLDAYPIRIMLGLVMSLSLMLALVRLPVQSPVNRVGWSSRPPAKQIVLDEVTQEQSNAKQSEDPAKTHAEPPPITDLQSPRAEPETSPPSSGNADTESEPGDSDRPKTYEEIQSITELGLSDHTPQIVGGLGSLYLHINYPARAREQGIEGELELEFTVEPDGRVTDLEVVKSLHPLCDSAAVQGIRSVQFIPAKQNGTPIPIRLRLPMEFRLKTQTSAAMAKGQGP